MWNLADTSVTLDNPNFFWDGSADWWAGSPGLSVGAIGSSSAVLSWAADTNEATTGYRLLLNGTTPLNVGNVTSFMLTGLLSSTYYQVQIAAFDAFGDSSGYLPATPLSFTTTAGVFRMLPQFVFGPGIGWITPVSDAYGNAISNPAPILIAAMQDIGIDMSAELKELYGGNSYAIAIGRGKQKLGIKAKNAQVHGHLWNSLFFGQPAQLTSAVYTAYYDAVGTVVPGTPFTVTPATAYAASLKGTSPTFGYSLGVRDVNNLPLQRVASSPATRQYSVSGGVYTFAAADVGITYYFDFNYTATSLTAQQLNILNLPMGYAPTFQFDLIIPYQGNVFSATFPNCMSTKAGLATKLDDFAYPEFDFSAFAPGSAGVGTLSWSQ